MSYEGNHSDRMSQWRRNGEPLPTGAVRVNTGECAYEDCESGADYLVKAETSRGETAKTRICESCNRENDIMAERYLPDEQK